MPTNDNGTLKCNHGEKSSKLPYAFYVDFECLVIKQHSCQNNPNKSYAEKKLYVNLAATHLIQLVHLTQKKTNTVFIEEETAPKNFVKI